MKKYRDRIIKGIGILLLAAILIMALVGYAAMLDEQLNGQIIHELERVADRSVFDFRTEVRNQQVSLMGIAERIGDVGELDGSRVMEILRDIKSRYPFKRLGIAMGAGVSYTTDQVELNVGDREFFYKAMAGETGVSQRLTDHTDGEAIVVFSTPIHVHDKVEGVLFATYELEDFSRILAAVSHEEGSSFCVVRSNGDVVVGDIDGAAGGDGNIYRILGKAGANGNAAMEMARLIGEEENGSLLVNYNGEKYLQVSTLGINDWYLLNLIPSTLLDETKNHIMVVTYGMCVGVCLLTVILIVCIIFLDKRKKQELERVLYVDSLTGGYSYQKFMLEARKKLDGAARKAAYIVMDIDQFKLIDELFGWDEGDKTLICINEIWKAWTGKDEIIGRSTADHFDVLAFYDKESELLQRVECFVNAVLEESERSGNGYVLKPKLGVYLVQDKAEEVQSMHNNAVLAHASIKNDPNVSYRLFDQAFKEQELHNKLVEDEMEQAYRKKEFIVYYQPKYDAKTGKMNGAEALVRWRKPDGTLIPPGSFIPLAEKKGFITKLDRYIFQEVCGHLHMWQEQGKQLVPVSVNVSREQLKDKDFMDAYENIWRESKTSPVYLEIELTESALFQNTEVTRRVVDELHKKGVRVLMDDFGTGYSSLMMLKTVPIDVMKLDKGFVDDYNDERGEKVIECVVRLAQSLRIRVTAEGVETKEQYEFLKTLGCDTIQGYYFARPMPAEDFERLLEDKD